MSYTALLKFDGQQIVEHTRLYNAWGFAPHIWTSLGKKYPVPPRKPYKLDNWDEVWSYMNHNTRKVDWHDLITVMFTYDGATVGREDFEDLSDALTGFAKEFPSEHVTEIAAEVREMPEEVKRIGLVATSVSGHVFGEHPYAKVVPYDLEEEDTHWDVFSSAREWRDSE